MCDFSTFLFQVLVYVVDHIFRCQPSVVFPVAVVPRFYKLKPFQYAFLVFFIPYVSKYVSK